MMEPLPQRSFLPSELENPQRTRVPTFPQRRRLRLPNRTNCQTRANRTLFQILVQNPKGINDRVCGCCRDFSHGRFASPNEWLATYQLQGTIERAVRNWKPLRFCSASYSTKEFMTGAST